MTTPGDRPAAEPIPPSRRIAALLREKIISGGYAPGDKLPTERALAQQHGVARNTAAAAIRILAGEGLVDTHQGSGAYVRATPRLIRLGAGRYARNLRASGLSPFGAEVTRQGRTPRVVCTSITRIEPPAEVAERLEISSRDETVVRRENHYFADESPMQIGITYAPWSIVEHSVISHSTTLGPGGIYARFDDLGHSVTRARDELSARMPIPEELAILAIPPGVPVLDLRHVSIDQNGRPFEVSHFAMRADHMAVDYDVPVED
ncbi:MAG: GntR family transcriptional regulator [Pseudonocardia sp.]|nr:GntR family transcriptional regulator [Pseudonocardia sp.]